MANPNMVNFLKNNYRNGKEITISDIMALSSGLSFVYPEQRGSLLKEMLNYNGPINIRIPDPEKGAKTIGLWLMPLRGVVKLSKKVGLKIDVSMSDLLALKPYIRQPLYGKLLVDLFS